MAIGRHSVVLWTIPVLIAPLTPVSVEAMPDESSQTYDFREHAVTTAEIQSYGSALSQLEGESK